MGACASRHRRALPDAGSVPGLGLVPPVPEPPPSTEHADQSGPPRSTVCFAETVECALSVGATSHDALTCILLARIETPVVNLCGGHMKGTPHRIGTFASGQIVAEGP